MIRTLFLILILSFSIAAKAQESFILKGKIADKKGVYLPGASIYVSDYKIATSSDEKGNYELRLKPGTYNILIQLIGYKASNQSISITQPVQTLNFSLEESITQLSDVNIKPDPYRLHYLATFKQFFIGKSSNADQCKIINPDILRLHYDRDQYLLTASSDDFLIIENKALGYRIRYLIKAFEYNFRDLTVYYEGYPHYEDLEGTVKDKAKWAEKRLEAYNGSAQHFFSALFIGRTNEEGFKIHKLIRDQAQEQAIDSIDQAAIGGLTSPVLTLRKNANNHLTLKRSIGPSLVKEVKPHQAASYLNTAEVLTDTLVHRYNDDIKKINFTNVLYVVYTREKENLRYKNTSGMVVSRPPDLNKYQVSLINIKSPIYFYRNGNIDNTRSLVYQGYWGWEKVADSVPFDYLPSKPEK